MRKLLASTIVLATVAGMIVVGAPVGNAGTWQQEVRAATARYHSVEQAIADGYQTDPVCFSTPAGTMGFHYVNPSLIGDGVLDPVKPEVVLYVPKAGGGLRLAAVEYLAIDADQNLATDDDRPSIFGQAFDGPMPGHFEGMPVHYDLHVWLWEENPSGTFAQFNPALSC